MIPGQTNKALIYDGECPFCVAYTRLFVRAGILKENQRIAFSEMKNPKLIAQMDVARQGNEIPLVDLDGGETIYGIDALIFLLSKKWKWINPVCKIAPVYFLLKHFYATISYNRRIILAKNFQQIDCSCAPAFNLKYRLAFIFFAAIFSVFITGLFGNAIAQTINFPIEKPVLKTEAICGTGWALTILFSFLFMKKERIDYIGHLAVLEIIGVLVLIPSALFAPRLGVAGFPFCIFSVLVSSTLMLRGHIKRTNILQKTQWWTTIWFFSLQLTAVAWILIFFSR